MYSTLFYKEISKTKNSTLNPNRRSLPILKKTKRSKSDTSLLKKTKNLVQEGRKGMDIFVKEAISHFSKKKENMLEFYDIPKDVQPNADFHDFKTLHHVNGTNNNLIRMYFNKQKMSKTEVDAFKVLKKNGRKHKVLLSQIYEELEAKEQVIDTLNEKGLGGVIKKRKERAEVVDLDDWKRRMKNVKKGLYAQSKDEYARLSFLKELPNITNKEIKVLEREYRSYSLRQNMLDRIKFSQIIVLEQKKNDLFLNVYNKKLKELEGKIMTRSHEINKIFLEIKEYNKNIKVMKEKLIQTRERLEDEEKRIKRRKRLLKNSSGKLDELKKLAITHSATAKILENDRKLSIAFKNSKHLADSIQRDSAFASRMGEDDEMDVMTIQDGSSLKSSVSQNNSEIDIFEFDPAYKKSKALIKNLRKKVSYLQKSLLKTKRRITRGKNGQEKIDKEMDLVKKSMSYVQKSQMDFLMKILKEGKDSRVEGIVWMMSKIKKLGGQIREDLLPDILDEESKQFMMKKMKVYEKLLEQEALYKFYWDVFKGFIEEEGLNKTYEDFNKMRTNKFRYRGKETFYIKEPQSQQPYIMSNLVSHRRGIQSAHLPYISRYEMDKNAKKGSLSVRGGGRKIMSLIKISPKIKEVDEEDSDLDKYDQDSFRNKRRFRSKKKSKISLNQVKEIDEKDSIIKKEEKELEEKMEENIKEFKDKIIKTEPKEEVKKEDKPKTRHTIFKEYGFRKSITDSNINFDPKTYMQNVRRTESPDIHRENFIEKLRKIPIKQRSQFIKEHRNSMALLRSDPVAKEFFDRYDQKILELGDEEKAIEALESQLVEIYETSAKKGENKILDESHGSDEEDKSIVTSEEKVNKDNRNMSKFAIKVENTETQESKLGTVEIQPVTQAETKETVKIIENLADEKIPEESKEETEVEENIALNYNRHPYIHGEKTDTILDHPDLLQKKREELLSGYSLPVSAISQSITFIGDQNYKLPYEEDITGPKQNFSELCFEKGRELVKEMIMKKDESEEENMKEDDPFNMNVMFYEGETPINDFKSRKEFINRELKLEKSIENLKRRIEVMNEREAQRVLEKFTELEKKRLKLLKKIKGTKLDLRLNNNKDKIMQKFGLTPEKEEKERFDFGTYLSSLIGFPSASRILERKIMKDRLTGNLEEISEE